MDSFGQLQILPRLFRRTSYTGLLALCGFSYQKTEKVFIFKSRSESKVADFEEQLEKN